MTEARGQGIGQALQDARLQNGLSLDDIQQSTKIQKRYLQAIENDQLDQLPGAFYERAFIRQYANAVGLDAQAFMQAHNIENDEVKAEMTGARVDADHVTRAGMHRNEDTTSDKTRQVMPKVLLGIGALVVIGIAWALTVSVIGSSQAEKETTNVSVSTSQVDATKVDADDASAKAASKKKADDAKKKETDKKKDKKSDVELGDGKVEGNGIVYNDIKAPNKPMTLQLSTPESVWLEVKDNTGKVLWGGTLKEGDKQEIDLPANLTGVDVQIGNANALDMQVDGQKVELKNDKKDVWHAALKFKRDQADAASSSATPDAANASSAAATASSATPNATSASRGA